MSRESVVDMNLINFIVYILNIFQYNAVILKNNKNENGINKYFCQFEYPHYDNKINPLRLDSIMKQWELQGKQFTPKSDSLMK